VIKLERKYWKKDSRWREKSGDWESEDMTDVHKPLAV
jgi:hypothetical protein